MDQYISNDNYHNFSLWNGSYHYHSIVSVSVSKSCIGASLHGGQTLNSACRLLSIIICVITSTPCWYSVVCVD